MYDLESSAFCLPNALNEEEGQEQCVAFRKVLIQIIKAHGASVPFDSCIKKLFICVSAI